MYSGVDVKRKENGLTVFEGRLSSDNPTTGRWLYCAVTGKGAKEISAKNVWNRLECVVYMCLHADLVAGLVTCQISLM